MITWKINYNNNSSELCEIGRRYDTDKSSQRDNVTDDRHCHPYTLFYDTIFKNRRNDPLKIAELGILNGSSLLMWREYFTNAEIYGFEYNQDLINNFKEFYDNERISLSHINVNDKESIEGSFSELNIMYDVIIDDTTHIFEDQIRIIENTYQYLKPGGMMIIEDIFKSNSETEYISRLADIIGNFQDFYFIELDHNNKVSTGWDNDKLFILIKGGGEPIFKNTKKITIITPCHRLRNLQKIKDNICFDYVDEWIIVYDGSKIRINPEFFKNDCDGKIKEYIYTCNNGGVWGNPQRNYALGSVKNPNALIYYLDDDNLIHPHIYKLLDIIDNNKLYTFNTEGHPVLFGKHPQVGAIDTAMVIIPHSLCSNERWVLNRYDADGVYIVKCYNDNKDAHIYVDNKLCYYNTIR
jgi:predicted O-methyltransferase YrrM